MMIGAEMKMRHWLVANLGVTILVLVVSVATLWLSVR